MQTDKILDVLVLPAGARPWMYGLRRGGVGLAKFGLGQSTPTGAPPLFFLHALATCCSRVCVEYDLQCLELVQVPVFPTESRAVSCS